jgi:transcriptional regulator with XRE-family HTH domain/Zn-dependent peptidase ImmA (M78 family)
LSPEQLASYRRRLGLTQSDLADSLGVSRAMISYWESGKREPLPEQELALAKLLGLSPQMAEDASSEPFLTLTNRRKGLTPRTRIGLRNFVTLVETYGGLLAPSVLTLTQISPLRPPSHFTLDAIRRRALETRTRLGLGTAPVDCGPWLLESLGTLVIPVALGNLTDHTVPGAYWRHPLYGTAIALNRDIEPALFRYTLAHLAGHVVLHSDAPYHICGDKDQKEMDADSFAMEFLAPYDMVRNFMDLIAAPTKVRNLHQLFLISEHFKMSPIVMKNRLAQATLLSDELTGQPLPETDIEGPDAKGENIGRIPPVLASRLVNLVERGVISYQTAYEIAGCAPEELFAPWAANR